ncbi:alginate lyase-domain-containing protein [Polychytrium aggregatum]|uniref:alginate lyase-domain-containing protein n=1 Tax=Polychytrium aggregatum TaxID=110093 RepID=UPI0022FE5C8E|nr:alginate lyase-domain-containing protein [Polychytrium aggregatum]KAI9202005.1 alginate lyase-domain-containing protein [Polychytrium aggregatum]
MMRSSSRLQSHIYLLLLVLLCCPLALSLTFPVDSVGRPTKDAIQTFYLDPQQLWYNRDFYMRGRKELLSAIHRVVRRSIQSIFDQRVYSVVNNSILAPSNSPHDFYSLARYFWPNVSDPTGRYIRYDGYVNPEVWLSSDPPYLKLVINDVFDTGLAYFFTGNTSYAAQGCRRLAAWFVNNSTRMNPNMNYENWVIGTQQIKLTGSSGGLLDYSNVYMLIDGFQLLRTAPETTCAQVIDPFIHWQSSFLDWLQSSPRGNVTKHQLNNQGTWYDVQVVSLMLLMNRTAAVEHYIQTYTFPRILAQIMDDGSQPLEMQRPTSWYYSGFNLQGLFVLGQLMRSTNLSLFDFKRSPGTPPLVLVALNHLTTYALVNGTGWPAANSGDFNPATVISLLKQAYVIYKDSSLIKAANQLQQKPQIWNPMRLWSPYASFDNPTKSSARARGTRGVCSKWTYAVALAVLYCILLG